MNLIRSRIRERRKQSKINAALKRRLFGRLFMSPCYHCKKVFMLDELTIEHIVPRSLGGTNEDYNIALACPTCNQREGRKAWLSKRSRLELEHHEQHSSQHNRENREITVQGT